MTKNNKEEAEKAREESFRKSKKENMSDLIRRISNDQKQSNKYLKSLIKGNKHIAYLEGEVLQTREDLSSEISLLRKKLLAPQKKQKQSKRKKTGLWFYSSLFLIVILLGTGLAIYNLNTSMTLNKELESLIKKKMQTADDIERSINFFEGIKEDQNARESD